MYVKIDLDDERFCDGCPCLRVILAEEWEFDYDGAECHADSLVDVDVIAAHGPAKAYGRWLRPQACIDASAEIDTAVWLVSLRPKPAAMVTDDAKWPSDTGERLWELRIEAERIIVQAGGEFGHFSCSWTPKDAPGRT